MLSLPSRVSEESERAWKVGPRWLEGSHKNEARVAVRREKEMGEKTRERDAGACVQQAGEVAARDFFLPAPLRFLRFCTLE